MKINALRPTLCLVVPALSACATQMDRAADGRIRIVDIATGNAVHVGDEIALSGGRTSEVLPTSVVPQIPPACQTSGGYFVAGPIMDEEQRQRILERQRNRPTVPPSPEAEGTRKDGA